MEEAIKCVVRNEPDQLEPVKTREICINSLSRGYVVRVGCQAFAFSKKEEMVEKLIEYINDPASTEKKWFEGKLFS